MTTVVALEAQKREKHGTGAARAVRNAQAIPAILYGPDQKPVSLSLEKKAMDKELQDPAFHTKLYSVKLDGKVYRAIIREVQYHPVTDQPLHIDLFHVSKGATIHVNVPVHFINEEKSPGMKRGGVLNIIMHELDLTCPADSIPEHITVDLDGLNLGDTVHLNDVNLPEGAMPTHPDREYTIATIVAPSAVKKSEAEAAEGEAAEGEEAEGGDDEAK